MDVVQHQILSLDFWQDTVRYEGKTFRPVPSDVMLSIFPLL
jgi:hypothetical protein